jgi:4-hydroxy-tetrahydrodipicolinate synthase
MHKGTIVPLITPLDGGVVAEKGVQRLIESVRAEVTGLMPALSSGEGWALSEQQWLDMVGYTLRHANGLPVLAGIQLPDTRSVIERSLVAEDLGVAAVVVTTPFGADVSQDAILAHYRELRAAVQVPIFLYNEQALSGNHIAVETLLRICELPGIAGIKESSGDAELTSRIAAELSIPVFEGWENLLSEVTGVAGLIGPLANLEPGLCNAMLAEPSARRQSAINEACVRYGVFKDDWYRWVKQELRSRGVIDSDEVVAP